MAVYTVNQVVKTLTIHKDGCRVIPWKKLNACGCGDTGQKDNSAGIVNNTSAAML